MSIRILNIDVFVNKFQAELGSSRLTIGLVEAYVHSLHIRFIIFIDFMYIM